MKKLFLVLALLTIGGAALAVSDPREMLPDPAQEARAETIGQQLRCLVCQNESIEDSNADLAGDLRRIVRERVRAGDSDAAVMAWMEARYGSFVRLNPRLTLGTLLLWGAPIITLLIGALAVFRNRRTGTVEATPLTAAETAALGDLLGKT